MSASRVLDLRPRIQRTRLVQELDLLDLLLILQIEQYMLRRSEETSDRTALIDHSEFVINQSYTLRGKIMMMITHIDNEVIP